MVKKSYLASGKLQKKLIFNFCLVVAAFMLYLVGGLSESDGPGLEVVP